MESVIIIVQLVLSLSLRSNQIHYAYNVFKINSLLLIYLKAKYLET